MVELAREFGTPAYVYAEDDMRARARTFLEAFRARPSTSRSSTRARRSVHRVYRLFAEEGLSADVASGGELHLRLAGGVRPGRLYMHGNNKSPAELDYAIERGIGHIVVDSFDEIERLRPVPAGIDAARDARHRALHALVHPDRAGGLEVRLRPRESSRAVDACAAAGLELCGLHAHIGSQIFELEAFEQLAEVLGPMGDWPLLNLGRGLGIAYTREDHPRSRRTWRRCCAARPTA